MEVDARSRGTRTALPLGCENVPKGEGFSPKKEHTPTAHSESANILEISSCQVENQNQRVKYFREAKLTDRAAGTSTGTIGTGTVPVVPERLYRDLF